MSPSLEAADIESLRATFQSFRHLLTLEAEEMQKEVVRELSKLFKAESGALFYQRAENRGFIRLIASAPSQPNPYDEPLDLMITAKEKAGMTGYLATLRHVATFDRQALRKHPSVAHEKPGHLSSADCFSMLAIPLRDERDHLIALLKFENKLGPAGKAAEQYSFTEKDQFMARLVSEPVAALIESSLRRSALLELSRSMAKSSSGERDCENVLSTAVSLLSADRADLAVWFEGWDEIRIVKQVGAKPPVVTEGQILPENTAMHDQWSLKNKFFPAPKESLEGYSSRAVHPGSRSEVVYLCYAAGEVKAVLNIESSEPDWFRDNCEALLELLEPFVIQAIEKLETRDSSEWPPGPPGFGWFRVFRRLDLDENHPAVKRLHWSVSPACARMFGLSQTASGESYVELMDERMGPQLQDALIKAVLEDDPLPLERISKKEFTIGAGSRPARTVRFFGASSGLGEVHCVVQDISEERIDPDAHMEKDWQKDILPWLRVGFSNGKGEYVHVTQETALMYGFKNADEFHENIGNATQLYFRSDDREDLMKQLEKNDFVENFEFATTRPGNTTGKPITYVSQDVLCNRTGTTRDKWKLLACFHDIGDRVAMERKLCMAGVAGALLHDAKRPFVEIRNHALTLEMAIGKPNPDHEECRKQIEKILTGCKEGVADAEHWLEIAKGRKDVPDYKHKDIMIALKSAAEAAENLKYAEVHIKTALPANCSVKYNSDLLKFAFQQLLRNIQPSKLTGKRSCEVTVSYAEPMVTIMFDDEGHGFGKDFGTGWKAIAKLDKALKKATDKDTDKGGLGLVMCNAVIELHNGKMNLSDWRLPDGSVGGARVTLQLFGDQTSIDGSGSAKVEP